MPRQVEIDLTDVLTVAERRTLDEAFDVRDDATFILRHGVSDRAVARALPLVKRLLQRARLPLPEPPQPADWRVWQSNREGWKYEALAAPDSPVRQDLRGSTSASRKVLAINAVKRIARLQTLWKGIRVSVCCQSVTVRST